MMLGFCARSLLRSYGWNFLRHVAWRHPLRTLRAVVLWALRGQRALDPPRRTEDGRIALDDQTMVALGFCMKPLDPPCPAGRANHDCTYLERGVSATACRGCPIGEAGRRVLAAGAPFYIMTSAQDILDDLFRPAIDEKRYRAGVFGLCRYSFDPFTVPLLIANMHGTLLPFEEGDCRDYPTWLRADEGDKEEQTCFLARHWSALLQSLPKAEDGAGRTTWRKQGNVLVPKA